MEDDISDYTPDMQKKRWEYGYVYLIDYGDGKQFKIGKTKNDPKKRTASIKSGSGLLYPEPLDVKLVASIAIFSNAYFVEQLLHMEFAEYHRAGEWFLFDNYMTFLDVVSRMKDYSNDIELYDRWYEMVPADWDKYVENFAIPNNLIRHNERPKPIDLSGIPF